MATSTTTSAGARSAAISRAERYWLDSPASSVVVPPRRVPPSIAQGHVALAGQVLDARRRAGAAASTSGPHRPLAQAGHAVEPPEAGDHGERRDQEAEHGAGVAAEDLDLALRPPAGVRRPRPRLLDREAAAAEARPRNRRVSSANSGRSITTGAPESSARLK